MREKNEAPTRGNAPFELKKIEDVFLRALDKSSVPVCTAGDLYLGSESVLFTDGSSWYRIKFSDIREINISDRAKKIFFRLSDGIIGFSRRDEYRLSGLFHLLRPFTGNGMKPVKTKPLKTESKGGMKNEEK